MNGSCLCSNYEGMNCMMAMFKSGWATKFWTKLPVGLTLGPRGCIMTQEGVRCPLKPF